MKPFDFGRMAILLFACWLLPAQRLAAAMVADAKQNVYYLQHPRGALIGRLNDESWSFFCGDHAIFRAPIR
jgi:hypothetical protein